MEPAVFASPPEVPAALTAHPTPAVVPMMYRLPVAASLALAAAACSSAPHVGNVIPAGSAGPAVRVDTHPGERHLANIRQLTFAGENAEAYFSRDGQYLIFQSQRDGRACDQQYVMRTDGSGLRMVSNGEGKTTCGYFFDNDRRIIYSSTKAAGPDCPPRPDPSAGYAWGLDTYDLYTANRDGSNVQRLTHWNSYTAEATLSPDGQTIVFTSLKDGDLDIYTMRLDGTGLRKLTNRPGYAGGPFFSPDGTKIVFRAWYPTGEALEEYKGLLARRMVRPGRMELWTMDADGSNQRQVTQLGGANFAPFFTPDGQGIIFSSNHENPRSRNFDLYVVKLDGTGLRQITTHPEFDGFPMFSPDGKQLVWASNRHAAQPGETNVFIADWIP